MKKAITNKEIKIWDKKIQVSGMGSVQLTNYF